MEIKVHDGIRIVIDDEKLISWEQSKGGSVLTITMKDEERIHNFEFDASEIYFKRVDISK